MIAPHSEAAAPTSTNPGETLRTARENKNWTLSSVAKQLNLSERSLSQIEAGDFSQLPGHTFARGYVRAYAKLLGLDQNRLVQQFDQHTGTDATGSSVNSLGHIDEPVRLSRSMVRFFTLILTLAIAVGAFLWWQDRTTRNEASRAVAPLERIEVEAADGTTEIHLLDRADEPAELATGEPTDSTPSTTDDEAQDSDEQTLPPDEQPEAEAPIDAPEEAVEAVPASEAPITAPQADTGTTPVTDAETVATGEGRITLDYTADCWTRVTDAEGKVLYSGLGKAGTSRALVGKTPLDVHLGFASGVQVSFNGEAVSLSGKTRGETARFKLGQ
ncbi:RodZ domain-containing protein [Stutzerimonas stutzeri]|uniref:Cro/Cl family transcriptional regulator n=1 Tax=Stutzerimonas stutzeri TaxID=316 RepID=A0A0D9AIJ1_STUST|nr:RodZ family helix-turn-helix domain-containing protein [Stutzerimonas stutzeri]KJH80519.1 Cro/Cl family transcriptional regulator [Stutzerimonas stutzeri]